MAADRLDAVRAEGGADVVGGRAGDIDEQRRRCPVAQPGHGGLEQVAVAVELVAPFEVAVARFLPGRPKFVFRYPSGSCAAATRSTRRVVDPAISRRPGRPRAPRRRPRAPCRPRSRRTPGRAGRPAARRRPPRRNCRSSPALLEPVQDVRDGVVRGCGLVRSRPEPPAICVSSSPRGCRRPALGATGTSRHGDGLRAASIGVRETCGAGHVSP